MHASRSAQVRAALDDLKRYLQVFVVEVRGNAMIPVSTRADRLSRSGQPEMVSVHAADISALAGVVLDEWNVFGRRLSALARSYFRELKDIRNHWAHEKEFSEEETNRSLDTIRLVGKAIGRPDAPTPKAPEPSVPSTHVRPVQTSSAAPTASRSQRTIERDADGVIINAAELVAAQLSHERVLCPACRRKVFAMWPEGWDAHAGSLRMCVPDLGGTAPARKQEFKRRYRALFR